MKETTQMINESEWAQEMALEAKSAQQEEVEYENEYRTPNWDMMDEDMKEW